MSSRSCSLRACCARALLALVPAIVWGAAADVSAGVTDNLYGMGTGAQNIYRIDPQTAAGVSVYTNYPNAPSLAAAQRATDGMIYYIAGSAGNDSVYRWNPLTPATAPVLLGQTGAGVPFLPRLAFSQNGTLYGSAIASGGTVALYTINQTTGAATFSVNLTGETTGSGGDMAFGPNGTLYIVCNNNLYSAPIGGGPLTLIGVISGLSAAIPAVAFDRDGRLIVASGETPGRLYWVNLSTAVATLIGTLPTKIDDLASAPRLQIDGKIYEDVNYGGGAGRSFAASAGVGRTAARIELFDGAGDFITQTTSGGTGAYTLTGAASNGYAVRVVNSSVTSSRPNATAGLLAVQTFRTDASSGTAAADVNRVGGEDPAKVDAGNGSTTLAALTTGTTTAQSISPVTLGASSITGVDFGFNFDTIVSTRDAGQGSLREFLTNSNTLGNAGLAQVGQPAGVETSIFMISNGTAVPGLRAGLTNQLIAGRAVISPTTALPAIADASTSLDGTTQTARVGDTNPVVLGTGGAVGVDGLTLPQVAGPEVELRDGAALSVGLLIQASAARVRGVAILGFGAANGQAAIRIAGVGATDALVEDNVLGATALSFSDPGAALRNYEGVDADGATGGTIRDNLIGFGARRGIFLQNSATSWAITGNEIRDSGLSDTDGDGISINQGTGSVAGNLITGSSSQAVAITNASGSVFTNNTLIGNGVGTSTAFSQTNAVALRATASSTSFDRNVIQANYGAGLAVNDGATDVRLTRNSFADNGTITARNGGGPTGQVGIDLNSSGEDPNLGTPPFRTVNDSGDADAGGNGLLNFPILTTAALSGGNLLLDGFARPGSVIELFVVAADPSGFGEGQTWKITLTEGGTGSGGDDPYADTNAGTGTYGPGAINGLAQGTDTTNQFRFTFPTPSGISNGTVLTATATLGGNTSEFSGNVTVTAPPGAISGRAFEDANFAGTASDYDGGTSDLAMGNVDVELYDADTNAYITSTNTAGDGTYSFIALGAGNYKVRVRAATIGDADTQPRGGLNASVPATWPYPVAVMTWGNGGARYGGQSATVDDTATGDNAGPGDDFVTVTVVASPVVSVNFGFAYNLIVNANDDSNADASRSVQGGLRQFIKNANAIGTAGGTTASSSQFRMQVATNQSSGADAWWRITTSIALPAIADDGTVLDASTQTTNGGNTNTLGPEIELVGNGAINGINLTSASNTVRGLAASGYDGNPLFAAVAISGAAATGNTVAGNYLGTNATGTAAAVTRNYQGVAINTASGNTIGGLTAADRNVLSGNRWNGVRIRYAGATGNTVVGNYVGTNAAGTAAVLNQIGVYVWDVPGNTIGGTAPTATNVVSGNAQVGVYVFGANATGNVIQGNTIGLDAARSGAVANGFAGAQFASSANNLLGGTAANAGNVVAANGNFGVVNTGGAGAVGNAIVSNSIRANVGLGIDLGSDGPTLNDALDADPGANDLLNFPAITSASVLAGTVTARFDLDVPAGSYRVEFFKNPSGTDPSTYGEGEVLVGAITIAHPGGGSQSFSHTFAGALADVLTATTTVCTNGATCTTFGSTSEFSGIATVTVSSIVKRGFLLDGTPLPDGAVIPKGTRVKFLLYIDNPGGAIADVSLADVLDPAFTYLPGTIRTSNSAANCAGASCTPAEESAILAATDAAPAGSDAIDLDAVSFSGGAVRAGNQAVANAQLDIAGARVFALVFTVRVQ